MSKIYKRLMHDNMGGYFNDVLSKFQWASEKVLVPKTVYYI